jgi:hypothetical protein
VISFGYGGFQMLESADCFICTVFDALNFANIPKAKEF